MRYPEFLRGRYRAILDALGRSLIIVGGVLLTPIALVPFHPEEATLAIPFVFTGAALAAIGLLLYQLFQLDGIEPMTYQEGTVVVVLVWLMATAASMVPYISILELTVTQAAFEAVSGWTTTGLSVIDVTEAPRIVLLFRSITQLAGGAGVAIIVMSSLAGPAGIGLTTAEGRSAQLVPNVRESASIVLRIYTVYAVLGFGALWLAGMAPFDALNHAFAAISTGGFSTRPESIGYWDSPAVEGVILVLMWLGAFNFLTAYTLFTGKIRTALRNSELRFGLLVLIAAVGIMLWVTLGVYPSLAEAVRTALFEATSAATSAGFTRTNYAPWPEFGWLIIIGLMVVGGSTESTAGGIKYLRIYVLLRTALWEIRKAFLPQFIVNEPEFYRAESTEFITEKLVRQVGLFAFFYIALFFTGAALVTAHGYSLRDGLFEFASALGTTGLSAGVTAADAAPSLLWVLMGGMVLGRLEILAVVIGLGKLVTDLPVVLFKHSD